MDMLPSKTLEGEDPVFEAGLLCRRADIEFSGFYFKPAGYFFNPDVRVV